MNDNETIIFDDHQARQIRLTGECYRHILEHPEMNGQFERIRETITAPQLIVKTATDENVQIYHRHYQKTPVTSKFLLVAIKFTEDDAFILTAFFSSRQKKGYVIWSE